MGINIILTPTQAPVTLVATPHTEQSTVWDVVDAMTAFLGADPGENVQAVIKRSMIEARTEFQGASRWNYLVSQARLFLNAMQTEGTVEYDHTGGAYERLLTLDGATWPDWAVYGMIRIAGKVYTVARVLSATELQLDEVLNPGEDIDAETEYSLGRDTYAMPEDFVGGDAGMVQCNWGDLEYVAPAEWARMVRYTESFARPSFYTFTGDPRAGGRLALRLYPCPDAFDTIDFVYSRKMREFSSWDQSTGKITVTGAPSRQVVITGGTFKAYMVGDILRISDNSRDIPTDRAGQNPYVLERTIMSVVDANTALVDEDIPDNYASVAYRISSPVDVEEAMSNAFLACVRKRVDRHRRSSTMAATEKQWNQELLSAREHDQRDQAVRVAGLRGTYRRSIKDMPLGPEV